MNLPAPIPERAYGAVVGRRWIVQAFVGALMLLCPAFSAVPAQSDSVLTVGEARVDANGDFIPDRLGQRVTVAARASSYSGILHTSRLSVFLQDERHGIEVYNVDMGEAIEEGDSVIATGTIEMYEGVTRLTRARYRVIKMRTPMARPITLSSANLPSERLEGMLVRVHGAVTRAWKDDYGEYLAVLAAPDDADTIVVFLSNHHKPGIRLQSISIGKAVTITGVLGQYARGGPLDSGYEIYPRYPEDVRVDGSDTETYLLALSISAALVALTLIWVVAMRRQVARRTRELSESEERLSASLREKEILLKEVYHRVKNNLQTISSLLSLQSESITDPATRELFTENQNRIRSMAMIHERLYRSKSLARIDFKEYLEGLATSLFRSYKVRGDVALRVDVKDVSLEVNAAITCGLIVNELLSNALKHAFPENRPGEVVITMLPSPGGSYSLTFSDNGIGLPADYTMEGTQTLGMTLIATLTQQLRGTLDLETQNGTRYIITFPGA